MELTLCKVQILFGGLQLIGKLTVIAQKPFVHFSASIGALLERSIQVAEAVKIHAQYCIFNINLGDWGEVYLTS